MNFTNMVPMEEKSKSHSTSTLPEEDGNDFWSLVGRFANCLRQLGLGKGDRLAGQVSKTSANYAMFLATLQLGAIYLPLNTDYTFDEIRYFLSNSEPTVFVCRPESLEHYLSVLRGGVYRKNGHPVPPDTSMTKMKVVSELDIRDMALASEALMDIFPVSENDVASICYTSGTTGKPKGAMITHKNLQSNAEGLSDIWEITQKDVLLHALPIYHVHGLFVALNPLLMQGGSVILLPRFELDTVLEWLPKANLMMGVPTYYTRLLQSKRFNPDLVEHFRLFISGSAPLDASAWKEFQHRSGGHRILERYGMTEGQMVCSNPFQGHRKPGTVGKPLPHVEVRIVENTLEYRGPNVFRGYWRMEEKTREEFREGGWFVSGDLAEIDDEGYVRIMGRGKDLIISGGLNVYPKEVEDVLGEWGGVAESAVVGVPHIDFGEAVVAAVVLKNQGDHGKNKEREIIDFAKQKLAGFKVPKKIFLHDRLPRNNMGKIQKNVLREKYKNIFLSTTSTDQN